MCVYLDGPLIYMINECTTPAFTRLCVCVRIRMNVICWTWIFTGSTRFPIHSATPWSLRGCGEATGEGAVMSVMWEVLWSQRKGDVELEMGLEDGLNCIDIFLLCCMNECCDDLLICWFVVFVPRFRCSKKSFLQPTLSWQMCSVSWVLLC